MKAVKQYFPVILLIFRYKLVVTFEFVEVNPKVRSSPGRPSATFAYFLHKLHTFYLFKYKSAICIHHRSHFCLSVLT